MIGKLFASRKVDSIEQLRVPVDPRRSGEPRALLLPISIPAIYSCARFLGRKDQCDGPSAGLQTPVETSDEEEEEQDDSDVESEAVSALKPCLRSHSNI